MSTGKETDLTHISQNGEVRMVDVSVKPDTMRIARASGHIKTNSRTVELVQKGLLKKGDVLAVARVAAIMAAKKTGELIPLCHPLPLTGISVEITADTTGFTATCEVKTVGKTGAEMEALTAVSSALLTIYDMCKGVDKTMEIGSITLVEKRKEQL